SPWLTSQSLQPSDRLSWMVLVASPTGSDMTHLRGARAPHDRWRDDRPRRRAETAGECPRAARVARIGAYRHGLPPSRRQGTAPSPASGGGLGWGRIRSLWDWTASRRPAPMPSLPRPQGPVPGGGGKASRAPPLT